MLATILFFVLSTSLVASSLIRPRGIPANVTDLKTIESPNGATIRYKEPGICETKPGVKSYAGYVSLNATTNMFFWFFEARHDPHTAPFSLWLNGGPGSDSLLGLFQENGPCNVTENLEAQWNPYSWNEVSNMIYLSQPIGVGFSYSTEEVGSFDPDTGDFQNASEATPDGRYGFADSHAYDTSDLAAAGTWEILQAFFGELPHLDPNIASKKFSLWTESYGGHYGPSFFHYFQDHNAAIANGTETGTKLNMDSLGIGNGIIDAKIQSPYYAIFAVNNTYGIKAVNDTVYTFMLQVYYMPGGCRDWLDDCAAADRSTFHGQTICSSASNICRSLIRNIYIALSGRGTYDIRHPHDDPTPPGYYEDYLNLAEVQQALGVNLNYSDSGGNNVFDGFMDSGDFAYPIFKTDLEAILNSGVRVALYHGDADYTCNWLGGEAVSLALNYSHAAEFAAAGYTPFVVNGVEYGEVRQAGNFSFTRIYESGHEVPYYQPEAALALFDRTLNGLAVSDGVAKIDAGYGTNGTAKATHTEPSVGLPSSTSV